MDKGVILSHKNTKHEFYISPTAKSHIINVLIRRAFHLNSDVKFFRHPRGYTVSINEIFQLQHGRNFQIITEQDPEISREKSENYSQRNLAKSSGRKYPPSQKQLLDSKFFIDDFQLFMTEASSKKDRYFGIVFFSNKKKAQFLGKKILRQLVFQFDHIEFFYALHPIKTHSTPNILGDMLLFTIFKGSKMVKERQFPQNLSAIEQISGYLKLLLKNGELKFAEKRATQKQKPKNLIQVQQQRSFDQKIESPKLMNQQNDPYNKLDLFRMKSMTPMVQKKTNDIMKRQVQAPVKLQSPMKSQLTHQISFQNEFYQPAWFFQGNTFNRIQKSFLSAFIKNNDQNLITFCHGLDLKNQVKQALNKKLMKVFLNELIEEKLSTINPELVKIIEQNQQNRQSPIFSLLLKLNKFGNIQDFLDCLTKQYQNLKEEKISYIEIARQLQKKKRNFGIVLFEGDDEPVEKNQILSPKLIGKHEHLFDKNCKIAEKFHKQPVEKMVITEKQIKLPSEFSQAQKAMITDRMLKHDPFLLQNYTIRKTNKKKYTVFAPQIVRKYLQSTETRYKVLEEIFMDLDSKMKLRKLSKFIGLLYFLYKQRIINKKQQKIFFYLYVWSDLNLLGAFQLYLHDMNLEQFADSLYIIDYQYYLQQKYGIQMTQVQNFTVEMQIQLVYLMVFGQFINLTDKVSIEKFIRAGDCTVLKIVKQNRDKKEDIIQKLKEFGKNKTQELREHVQKQNDQTIKLEKQKKQRKEFIQQIIPVHFKNLKKVDLIFECIDLQEPILSSIFEVYQQCNQLVEWIESFKMYIDKKFQSAHKEIVLSKLAEQEGIDFDKILQCPIDIIEGIYEMYILNRDRQDTVDSLRRIAGKMSSASKQANNRIVMKF